MTKAKVVNENPNRGGLRYPAGGRPSHDLPRRQLIVYCEDADWEKILEGTNTLERVDILLDHIANKEDTDNDVPEVEGDLVIRNSRLVPA